MLIKLHILSNSRYSEFGVPWSERGMINTDKIESIRGAERRGYRNCSLLIMETGDRVYVEEPPDEIWAQMEAQRASVG